MYLKVAVLCERVCHIELECVRLIQPRRECVTLDRLERLDKTAQIEHLCLDMGLNMRVGRRVDMCVDMCAQMHIDMCVDMCA